MDSMKGTVASWSICEINFLGIGWLVHVIKSRAHSRRLEESVRNFVSMG